MIQTIGMISGIVMPFFNIPLIIRIVRRRSSEDISLVWVVGAWICVMGMVPQSLQSPDPVLLTFGIVNGLFFTGVFVSVLFFIPPSGKNSGAVIDGSPAFLQSSRVRSAPYGLSQPEEVRQNIPDGNVRWLFGI